MNISRILSIVVTIAFLFPSVVLAQGMSELNIDGFEREKASETTAIRSPFVATQPAPRDLTTEDLFLNGVAIGPSASYALINGHTLKIGDSIAGLRVKSIDKKKVILQDLDRFHTLYLEGGF